MTDEQFKYLFSMVFLLCGIIIPFAVFAFISQIHKGDSKLLITAILVWYACLVLFSLIDRNRWPFYVFWFILTLYCTTAEMLYLWLDIRYFNVEPEIIFNGTRLSLAGILISYIIASLFTVKINFVSYFEKHVKILATKIEQVGLIRCIFICLFLIIIGIVDWHTIFNIGLRKILYMPRQTFRPYILSINHRYALIALPGTIFLLGILLLSWQDILWIKILSIISLVVYWGPFIIVGSRRELIYIITIGLLMLIFSQSIKKYRIFLISLGLILLLGFIIIPFAIRGYINIDPFLEFALPQYNLFLLMSKPWLCIDVKSTYDLAKGFWLLFPSALRPLNLTGPGTILQSKASLPFGLAFHPMAESFLNYPELAFLVFAILTTIVLLIILWFDSVNFVFGLIGFPYLLQWGRSDFWVSIFFILYTGIILSILLIPIKLQPNYKKLPKTSTSKIYHEQ